MPEGFDRADGAEAPAGESLEDIREEFREKYGEDEGRSEPSGEGPADNDSAEPDGSGPSGRETKEEQGEADGRGAGDENAEFDSSREEAGPPETDSDDPKASLEEYREEVLERYERSEDADAVDSGQKSGGVSGHDEARAEPREETGESQEGPEVSDSEETAASRADEDSHWTDELDSARGGSEEIGAVGPPGLSSPESADKVENYGGDLEPRDLEEFRERILEEYDTEGLGESTPEGQLYDLAREEMEEGKGSAGFGGADEIDRAEGGAGRADAPEAGTDSTGEVAANGAKEQASDWSSQAETDGRGAANGLVGAPEAGSVDSSREGPAEDGATQENQIASFEPDGPAASDSTDKRVAVETQASVEAMDAGRAEPAEARKEPEAEDFQPPPTRLGELGAAAEQPGESKPETERNEPREPGSEETRAGQPEADRFIALPRTVESGPMSDLQGEADGPANLPDLRYDARVAAAHTEAVDFHEQAVPGLKPMEDVHFAVRSGNMESVVMQVEGACGGGHPGLKSDAPRPLEPGDSAPQKELAAAETGGHIQNDNQVAVAEQEGGPKRSDTASGPSVEARDARRFQADSERHAHEARVLEVVDYGKGNILRVPKTDLERTGFKPDEAGERPIAELQLKDLQTEDGEQKTVFARYSQSDRRAEVHVDGIGGEKGSRYELVEAREYGADRFVRDFQRNRCEHFPNVKLEHEDDRMFVSVDDRKVELENWRLSTSGHQAVLSGRLEGEADFRVEFDGRKETVKFGRGCKVDEMKMEGDELVVSYSQSRNEKHQHRMYLEHLKEPERPSLNQFDKPEMLEHVKASEHPERIEGVYQFALDSQAQGEIKRLLDAAEGRGEKEYGIVKAEVSERLAANLLETFGWERIERHPFSTTKKESAAANGVDWLVRAPDGKLALMEVKWWGDPAKAESRGSLQVARAFKARRNFEGEDIVGAYVAVMDWHENDTSISIFVKRVRPGVKLA